MMAAASPLRRLRFQSYAWLTLGVLLGGIFLRWASLGRMEVMLHYDEAYNGLDALNLLRHPRFTPFLPGNFGRESGWVYTLIPFIVIWGARPFALRFAATVVGSLTLAATYRLGRELFGPRAGVWCMAALAVLYWHVQLSHLALRANLLVLLATLAAGWVLRALRCGRWRDWLTGGAVTGALIYTYFSAAALMAHSLALLAGIVLLRPGVTRRRAAVAIFCAALVVLPMAWYVASEWDTFRSRPQTVAAFDPAAICDNLRLWGAAWVQQGDTKVQFNLPGRPILDLPLALLAGVGCLALMRYRWAALWLFSWAALALMPSLLSNQAPHFLRAAVLTVPTALVAGLGAARLARLGRRWVPLAGAGFAPLLLLLLSARTTYVDFHQRWMTHPETSVAMEVPLNRAITYVGRSTAPQTHVYISPLTMLHPLPNFRGAALAPRSVAAFDSHQCLVLPQGAGVYISLTKFEPGFAQTLARWAQVRVLARDDADPPLYTVLAAAPDAARLFTPASTATRFGDLLLLRRLTTPSADPYAAGAALPLTLGLQPLAPIEQPYSVFVHLYGNPTPAEGGPLWAQADSQICSTYPPHLWRTDEIIVQSFDLTLPSDLPPGAYTVVAGIYAFPNGARLPLADTATDSVVIQELTVEASD